MMSFVGSMVLLAFGHLWTYYYVVNFVMLLRNVVIWKCEKTRELCLLHLSSHHLILSYFYVCPIFVRREAGWPFILCTKGRYLPEVCPICLTMT
jgi:hypothetical protein